MTSAVVRFPPRRSAAVWLFPAREGGWLVLVRGHGWRFGCRHQAQAEAMWLAINLSLPVRATGGWE
jgi:hypothetical protein